MKKILFLLSSVLLITACSDHQSTDGTGEIDPSKQGKLKLFLEPGDPIIIDNNAQKSAEASKATLSTDMSKFSLGIKDNTGKDVSSYASYTQMPSELPLTAGTYTISAKNDGKEFGAAFDHPLYAGTSTFKVEVGQTTDVAVVCELKSTGVKVQCSPTMLATLTDITILVESEGQILFYSPTETRIGWFSVPATGSLSATVNATKIATGEPFSSAPMQLSEVKAKELRNVLLEIKTSGDAGVTIEIDVEVISKDVTIPIPDGDDIIDNNGDNGSWEEDGEDPAPIPQGPVITGASHEGQPFDLNQVIEVDRSDDKRVNELDVLITSSAAGGIEKLLLTIESDVLQPLLVGLLGINGQIDLANPPAVDVDGNPKWVGMFQDDLIGLIDVDVPIRGKASHMFSVGKLMALLGTVDVTGGVEHKFHLSIVDASGTTDKTLTVKLIY